MFSRLTQKNGRHNLSMLCLVYPGLSVDLAGGDVVNHKSIEMHAGAICFRPGFGFLQKQKN